LVVIDADFTEILGRKANPHRYHVNMGRGKREEGRGKREEGRGKREEGSGKWEVMSSESKTISCSPIHIGS